MKLRRPARGVGCERGCEPSTSVTPIKAPSSAPISARPERGLVGWTKDYSLMEYSTPGGLISKSSGRWQRLGDAAICKPALITLPRSVTGVPCHEVRPPPDLSRLNE